MKSALISINIFLLLLIQIDAFGQNYLMSDNHSGLHAGAQFSYNTFERHYAFLPGYTFDGRLTLGFDLGKTNDVVTKTNSTVLRPNISYLLVKQGIEGPPVSIDLNAGYQYNWLPQIQFNARSVQFGAGIFHEINPIENVKVIPSFFFEGNKSTTGVNPTFDEGVTVLFGAQVSIVWNQYYLTPKYFSFDGISTITVKLGMIFSAPRQIDEPEY